MRASGDIDRAGHRSRLVLRLLPAQTSYPTDENFAGSTVRSQREDAVDSMNQKRRRVHDLSLNRLGTR